MKRTLKPSKYSVKAGQHQYKPNKFRLWRLRKKHRFIELSAEVSFSANTKNHPIPEWERLQINKLFGFSWWAVARNRHSVRVGWRVLPESADEVQWFIYFRRRGNLDFSHVATTKKGEKTHITLTIIADRQSNPNSHVVMAVRQGELIQTITESFDFPQFFGYLAEPYFGGQGDADEPMTLILYNYQLRAE